MFQGVPLHVRAREVGGGRQGGGDGGMREMAACFRVFHYMYGPERCCMNSRRLDLIQYWKVLSQAGYSAAHTYRRMMHALYKQLANRKTRVRNRKKIFGSFF